MALDKVTVWERTFLSQRILHLNVDIRSIPGTTDDGMERREGYLLHSAQESSPRERFIWTSSGGMDFRIEEPLASEPDLMTVVVTVEGRKEGKGSVETGIEGIDRAGWKGVVQDYI